MKRCSLVPRVDVWENSWWLDLRGRYRSHRAGFGFRCRVPLGIRRGLGVRYNLFHILFKGNWTSIFGGSILELQLMW